MRNITIPLFSIFLIIASACATASEEDQLMQKAFNLHQEAIQVAKEAKDLLSSSDQPSEDLQSIRNRLGSWEDNLIEVPGYEHGHDHNHDHDHSHSTIELLPADMLAVQQEFLDSIRVIKNDLVRLQ